MPAKVQPEPSASHAQQLDVSPIVEPVVEPQSSQSPAQSDSSVSGGEDNSIDALADKFLEEVAEDDGLAVPAAEHAREQGKRCIAA